MSKGLAPQVYYCGEKSGQIQLQEGKNQITKKQQ